MVYPGARKVQHEQTVPCRKPSLLQIYITWEVLTAELPKAVIFGEILGWPSLRNVTSMQVHPLKVKAMHEEQLTLIEEALCLEARLLLFLTCS